VKPKIALIAAEPSGDLLGSFLARDLHNVSLIGMTGPRMRDAGVETIVPAEKVYVMGLTDVVKKLPSILHAFWQIKKQLLAHNPAVIVTIDAPAFNLKLARALRKSGYTGQLVHYVSPTVWAHGKHRIETMAALYDRLLCLFPFEPAYFTHTSLPTFFVGHPLTQIATPSHGSTIALFPGSRPDEIARNLPLQIAAAKDLGPYKISCASPSLEPLIRKWAPEALLADTATLLKESRGAFAKSGTITLELALNGIPAVVTYPVNFLNRLYVRWVARLTLPYFCLVNILKGREVFPEFIAKPATPEVLREALRPLLEETSLRHDCLQACSELRESLQPPTQTAAVRIQELL